MGLFQVENVSTGTSMYHCHGMASKSCMPVCCSNDRDHHPVSAYGQDVILFFVCLLQGHTPSVLAIPPSSPTTSGEAMPSKSKCPEQLAS